MKARVMTSLATLFFSVSAFAGQLNYTYSNTEYCELKEQGVSSNYLKAYAKKLGLTPAYRECKQLMGIEVSTQEQDVQQAPGLAKAKPARGNRSQFIDHNSVIRLPQSAINKLKDLTEEEREEVLNKIFF